MTIDSWEQYRVKTCYKCGKEKSMDDFYYHPQTRDNCSSYCKECMRLCYQKHKQNYNCKSLYGITIQQKEEMIRQQKGCCYLCDNTLPDNLLHRHIEHDPITKKVFGVSCRKCNIGIAMFNHDLYLMVKVAKRMLRLRKEQ